MRSARRIAIASTALAAVLAGCTSFQTPQNAPEVGVGEGYQAQYREADPEAAHLRASSSSYLNGALCDGGKAPRGRPARGSLIDVERLSSGDLVDLRVEDDDTFTRAYEVSADGTLKLPYLPPIPARGRDVEAVEADIARALVAEEFYQEAPRVSVRVTDFAPARVFVSGAVFEPGAVRVGQAGADDRDALRQRAIGGTLDERRISRALQSAGGIRPDADLSKVKLRRNGRTRTVDVRAAMTGEPYADLVLIAGDEIEVPSRGCFQAELVKPSPITTPGVTVFLSNLTVPANANALSAIGKEARELRYGTTFIQAVFGMNCVGGTKATNADRSALLFTRHPVTQESVVIERSIEDLLRRRDRDDFDPFLLPGDALACYDSTVTNVTDAARSVGEVIGAGVLLRP